MNITFVRDATHQNVESIPSGIVAALYTTGSPDIKATPQDFTNHPNAVRICQDHGSDITADVLDIETGAATPNDAVIWLPKARDSFNRNVRPGQRWPALYMNRSTLTPVANALTKAGLTNVPLWIAHPGMPQADAITQIETTSGPFPVIAVQIRFETTTDFDVFSTEWLNRRSGMVAKKPEGDVPPGQWINPDLWTWNEVVMTGIGLDGKVHIFAFDPGTGHWRKIL